MADFFQEIRVMRLYKYQLLVENQTNTEEKGWYLRLARALNQEIWLHPLSDFNDPFERHLNISQSRIKL